MNPELARSTIGQILNEVQSNFCFFLTFFLTLVVEESWLASCRVGYIQPVTEITGRVFEVKERTGWVGQAQGRTLKDGSKRKMQQHPGNHDKNILDIVHTLERCPVGRRGF